MHPHDGGLTSFGEQAVERMNKLGMAVSLGHASDQTVLDVAEVSEKPVFLSHNGARELMDSTRLNTDEGLKAVADTGGVIGINSAPHATATKEHPRHSIVSVMDHFEYIKDLVGIDHVTFGRIPSTAITSRSTAVRFPTRLTSILSRLNTSKEWRTRRRRGSTFRVGSSRRATPTKKSPKSVARTCFAHSKRSGSGSLAALVRFFSN